MNLYLESFGSFSDSFGVSEASDRQIEHLDTIDKDGNLCIMVQITRTTHSKSRILYNKLKDIGKIKPEIREFNLNADRKRFWLGRIESMNKEYMNDSISLSLNYFKIERI